MRAALKSLVDVLSLVLVLPAMAFYRIGAALLGPQWSFPGFSQGFSLIPGMTGTYLRRAFYRLVLPRCGDGACLCFGTVFSHPTAEVGRNVFVGVGCMLGDVTLEDDVVIASHVSIINGSRQHGIERLDVPIREQPGEFPRVRVGRDSWIGERSVVMADIGRHCVIGAGSVVTKPVPDFAIALGSPARVVRYRAGYASDIAEPGKERPQVDGSAVVSRP